MLEYLSDMFGKEHINKQRIEISGLPIYMNSYEYELYTIFNKSFIFMKNKNEFNIHSYVTYEEFQIYGYLIVGYDANGNKYVNRLTIDKVYGGNNLGGNTNNANINLTNGNINTLFGGGKKASTTSATTSIQNVTINKEIYGGGDEAEVDTVELNINNSTVGSSTNNGVIYGGGNAAKVNNTLELNINKTNVYALALIFK